MVNRLQQMKMLKDRKRRRNGRRAYLREFSDMKVPRKIGTSDIPEDQLAYFQYRRRGGSVPDPYLEALYPGKNQVGPTRLDAKAKAEKARIIAATAGDATNYITFHEDGIKRIRITVMHNRDFSLCYFVEVCRHPKLVNYVKRSKDYFSRTSLEWAFNNRQIEWEEYVEIRPG